MAETAERMGISEDAVRKRLRRGTLAGGKAGNEWYVLLHANETRDMARDETQDAGQDVQTPFNRGMGQDAGRDARRGGKTRHVSRQDVFDELQDDTTRMAVLEAELRGAQALLAHTQEQLAATRDEANFLRERLAEKDAVISRLSEAQVEALRRRDILAAQEREALPKPASSSGNRAWWQFWR